MSASLATSLRGGEFFYLSERRSSAGDPLRCDLPRRAGGSDLSPAADTLGAAGTALPPAAPAHGPCLALPALPAAGWWAVARCELRMLWERRAIAPGAGGCGVLQLLACSLQGCQLLPTRDPRGAELMCCLVDTAAGCCRRIGSRRTLRGGHSRSRATMAGHCAPERLLGDGAQLASRLSDIYCA